MAYSDLLDDEGINSQYLIVLKPRRLIESTWTLASGTIYTTTFTFTDLVTTIIELTEDGTALTEAASASVGSNEWFYNPDTGLLTIDVGADPTSSQVVVTYEIYFGTFDAHINRIPTDSTKRVVYYEPLIERSPSITNSTSDILFGFLPTFSASLTISNATHFLQEHIHTSSFSKAEFDLYHWLGELGNDNIKKVLEGRCRTINYTDQSTTFSLLDETDIFDEEYRNPFGKFFYNTTDTPDIDPTFVGRPIRGLFGVANGILPVNVDYVETEPTTSDNRDWYVYGFRDETKLNNFSTTVSASPSSTTTTTFVEDASGINIGDQVRNVGTSETLIVLTVTKTGSENFTHATATAASSAQVIDRKFIGKIQFVKEGVLYEPLLIRDWDVLVGSSEGLAGFSFTTSMEANLGITPPFEVFDRIWVRAYGDENDTTLGGPAFGADSSTTSSLTDPIVILFQLFKDIGIPESDINTASFTSVQAALSDEIGMIIPANSNEEFPTYKKLIIQITKSLLLKVFLDDDLKWKIEQVGPIGAADKTIEDDEVLKGSFRYKFDYQDILSVAKVQYDFREVGRTGGVESFTKVSSTSTLAQNLHKVEKQKTFTSLHFIAADAQKLADRMRFALGDRQGIVSFRTKNRFFDSILDEVIEISRDRLPGFVFARDVLRTTDFAVTKTSKSLRDINIELNDQKGIEDNSGSW